MDPPDLPSLEIERKYLLDGLPSMPAGAQAHRMEQGYFDPGRLRRDVGPDGTVTFTHTVKTGQGLVRTETECEISQEEFETLWPRTAGRRLTKIRYRIHDGDFVWEIDTYDRIDLVLAEVELPSPDTKVTIPPWLAHRVVREVTDDPDYQNYELAIRLSDPS